jgi:hypothetical protein
MKNQYFLAIFTMMMTASLVLPAVSHSTDKLITNGSKPINFGTQVRLQCRIEKLADFPTLLITNSTHDTVPSGKQVYWQVNPSMKGVFVLSKSLTPGKSVRTTAEAIGTDSHPVAWYFK